MTGAGTAAAAPDATRLAGPVVLRGHINGGRRAMLVRPDGYVAWATDKPDATTITQMLTDARRPTAW